MHQPGSERKNSLIPLKNTSNYSDIVVKLEEATQSQSQSHSLPSIDSNQNHEAIYENLIEEMGLDNLTNEKLNDGTNIKIFEKLLVGANSGNFVYINFLGTVLGSIKGVDTAKFLMKKLKKHFLDSNMQEGTILGLIVSLEKIVENNKLKGSRRTHLERAEKISLSSKPQDGAVQCLAKLYEYLTARDPNAEKLINDLLSPGFKNTRRKLLVNTLRRYPVILKSVEGEMINKWELKNISSKNNNLPILIKHRNQIKMYGHTTKGWKIKTLANKPFQKLDFSEKKDETKIVDNNTISEAMYKEISSKEAHIPSVFFITDETFNALLEYFRGFIKKAADQGDPYCSKTMPSGIVKTCQLLIQKLIENAAANDSKKIPLKIIYKNGTERQILITPDVLEGLGNTDSEKITVKVKLNDGAEKEIKIAKELFQNNSEDKKTIENPGNQEIEPTGKVSDENSGKQEIEPTSKVSEKIFLQVKTNKTEQEMLIASEFIPILKAAEKKIKYKTTLADEQETEVAISTEVAESLIQILGKVQMEGAIDSSQEKYKKTLKKFNLQPKNLYPYAFSDQTLHANLRSLVLNAEFILEAIEDFPEEKDTAKKALAEEMKEKFKAMLDSTPFGAGINSSQLISNILLPLQNAKREIRSSLKPAIQQQIDKILKEGATVENKQEYENALFNAIIPSLSKSKTGKSEIGTVDTDDNDPIVKLVKTAIKTEFAVFFEESKFRKSIASSLKDLSDDNISEQCKKITESFNEFSKTELPRKSRKELDEDSPLRALLTEIDKATKSISNDDIFILTKFLQKEPGADLNSLKKLSNNSISNFLIDRLKNEFGESGQNFVAFSESDIEIFIECLKNKNYNDFEKLSHKKLRTLFIKPISYKHLDADIRIIIVFLTGKTLLALRNLSNPEFRESFIEHIQKEFGTAGNNFSKFSEKDLKIVSHCLKEKDYAGLQKISHEKFRTIFHETLKPFQPLEHYYPKLSNQDFITIVEALLSRNLDLFKTLENKGLGNLFFNVLNNRFGITEKLVNLPGIYKGALSVAAGILKITPSPFYPLILKQLKKELAKQAPITITDMIAMVDGLAKQTDANLDSNLRGLLNTLFEKLPPQTRSLFEESLNHSDNKLYSEFEKFLSQPNMLMAPLEYLEAYFGRKNDTEDQEKVKNKIKEWKKFQASLAKLMNSPNFGEVFDDLWKNDTFRKQLKKIAKHIVMTQSEQTSSVNDDPFLDLIEIYANIQRLTKTDKETNVQAGDYYLRVGYQAVSSFGAENITTPKNAINTKAGASVEDRFYDAARNLCFEKIIDYKGESTTYPEVLKGTVEGVTQITIGGIDPNGEFYQTLKKHHAIAVSKEKMEGTHSHSVSNNTNKRLIIQDDVYQTFINYLLNTDNLAPGILLSLGIPLIIDAKDDKQVNEIIKLALTRLNKYKPNSQIENLNYINTTLSNLFDLPTADIDLEKLKQAYDRNDTKAINEIVKNCNSIDYAIITATLGNPITIVYKACLDNSNFEMFRTFVTECPNIYALINALGHPNMEDVNLNVLKDKLQVMGVTREKTQKKTENIGMDREEVFQRLILKGQGQLSDLLALYGDKLDTLAKLFIKKINEILSHIDPSEDRIKKITAVLSALKELSTNNEAESNKAARTVHTLLHDHYLIHLSDYIDSQVKESLQSILDIPSNTKSDNNSLPLKRMESQTIQQEGTNKKEEEEEDKKEEDDEEPDNSFTM